MVRAEAIFVHEGGNIFCNITETRWRFEASAIKKDGDVEIYLQNAIDKSIHGFIRLTDKKDEIFLLNAGDHNNVILFKQGEFKYLFF